MTNTPTQSAKSLRIPLLIATACLIGTACWVVALGDNLPGKPKPADKPVPINDVTDFTTLFATNCAACHGADGKSGPAPPLNDPLFRAIVPQNIVESIVLAGRAGTPMPAFAHANGGTLTAAQVQVLVFQIKGVRYKIVEPASDSEESDSQAMKVVEDSSGIAPVWGAVEPAPADAPSYLAANHSPVRTSKDFESIRTGIFAQACAGCHGADGEGGKITGANNNPEFLALASDQILRRVIITGLPELGMPDYKSDKHRSSDFKPLTSAQIDDLVALLAHWRAK